MSAPTALLAKQIARDMGVTVTGEREVALARSAIVDYADDLARRMADLRRKEDSDRRFGKFYTTAKVMELLGIGSRQAVTNMIRRGTILRVRTEDGRNAFPALQFDEEAGRLVEGLRDVLTTLLPAAATPWTVLDWLVTPMAELSGRRPVDAVRDNAAGVLALARQDAAAWAA